MAAENQQTSLPIAKQFMRSSPLPILSARQDERNVDSKFARRKPLPGETDVSNKSLQQTSTVRLVPRKNQDHYDDEGIKRDSGIDALAGDVSKLAVGNYVSDSKSGDFALSPTGTSQSTANNAAKEVPRSSLDKPLPSIPDDEGLAGRFVPGIAGNGTKHEDSLQSGSRKAEHLEQQLGVKGRIKLDRTEDTNTRTEWKPAVTHEIIRQNVYEIEEQQISRDIHQDHIFHRILPIEEVEVLPARHYVRNRDGSLREVTAQRPSRQLDRDLQEEIAKGARNALPTSDAAKGSRMFSARDFADGEGEYKQHARPDGSVRSERWWVHAPTLESGGIKSGQTRPFHLGSSNSDDDGLRR